MSTETQEKITQLREETEEERQIYDRQSFIGHDVQRRLINSKVLIVELTGSNTELAKNLILAGANINILDTHLITEQDTDTNFLFTINDLGKKRGEIGKLELSAINPLVKINFIETEIPEEELKLYDIIVTSTKCFKIMEKYDQISQKLNVPYYNIVCCGFSGFFYVSLGKQFVYQREKRVIRQIQFNANKQKKQKEPEYREFEEVIASSLPLDQTLNFKHQIQGFRQNLIYYCILMMKQVQEMEEFKDIDQLQGISEENLNKIVQIGCDIFKNATNKEMNQEQKQIAYNFAKFYGIDYCPVYSILGSVASQELIIVIGRASEPALNWFCYDSEECYGLVEVVQKTDNFKIRDLPERKILVQDD